MKILWVKAGKLLPVDSGGKIRSFNLLLRLAKWHEATLLTYYGGSRDRDYETEIARQFPGAVTVHTGSAGASRLGQVLQYLRCLPSRAPFTVKKFTHLAVKSTLAECLRNRNYDILVCDFLAPSLNFPTFLPVPTVLFQHNVETELWRRRAQLESNWFRKAVISLEAFKMTKCEESTLKRFNFIIAVSNHDREQFLRTMRDPSRIAVVSTGVDLEAFQARGNREPRQPLVMFVGAMDWEPNIDAMEYFCHGIWPLVQANLPDARFRIVGRTPHPRVRKLMSPTVEVTGTVPSIIDQLAEAAVVVVPLRAGGGTRLKIYEAMAMGKAIVSTSVGAEGLDVHHGKDILLADDAPSFAEGVISLLKDKNECIRLGKAAAELARRYDWGNVAKYFSQVLELAVRCSHELEVHSPTSAKTE